MPLLRRTSSSRKGHNDLNSSARKLNTRGLKATNTKALKQSESQIVQSKPWIDNSFFSSSQKAGQKCPINSRSGDGCDVNSSQQSCLKVDMKNSGTDPGLCTSTPKSKRKKKVSRKSVPISPALNNGKQTNPVFGHNSFDDSDSLFAELDVSGECLENDKASCPDHQAHLSKSGQKRKARTVVTGQPSSCSTPCKKQAKTSSDVRVPSYPNKNKKKEQVPLSNSGKMSVGLESVNNDAITVCDNELSDFDMLFPGSGVSNLNAEETNERTNKELIHGICEDDLFCDMSITGDICDNVMTVTEDKEPPCKPLSHGTVATPDSHSNLPLKERLKQKLQKNAKVPTPQAKTRLLQEVNLEEVKKDVRLLLEEGSEFDVGPFYGLPSKVQQLFETQRGISKLYDWQHECLSLEALRKGRNLIYSLPTSGGKTLVAEILILRELLCKKRDALLVLPFVSIVQEKVRGLSAFSVDLDFLVEEYAGSKGVFPPKKRRKKKSLYVATIEKANSLVNSLIEEGRLDGLGLCVVDELHMLGEGGGRGATLEMCLAKLMHCSVNTQIIGMSATLNNIKDLQTFLNAELYTNDFRPVELKEYVKMEEMVYSINPRALCPDDRLQHSRIISFKSEGDQCKKDPDHLTGLVLEIIPSHSCLLFCPTKKNCENVADLVCRFSPNDLTLHKKTEKQRLLGELSADGGGQLCPVLRRTIPYGVAYHHSGLTMDERKSLEEAYSQGTLCVLCCTSTLAAGVNLPAKRVILRSPYVGECFLSRSQYKQMVGRAGRAGIDSSGESILVMQKKDRTKLLELVSGPCDSCHSSLLYMDGKGMRSLVLTAVGLKVTHSRESVGDFVRRTLCYVQRGDEELTLSAHTALDSLIELGLVSERASQQHASQPQLNVTPLGRAVFKGSVDTDRGRQLYKDLCAARDSLCVANYLHLLYLVTPYDLVDQVRPTWMLYLDQVSSLGETEQKVASIIGVTESYLNRKVSGQRIRQAVDESVIKRFYLTLVLYSLWRQRTVWEVAHTFSLSRGFVQQLLSGAAAFASCVTRFCQELEEFWAYQDLLQNFVKKLSYCVTMELIPLMEIPGVKIGRARQLFVAGYRSLQEVAHADPEALVRQIEHMPRRAAKQIITAAKMLLAERLESLMEEVDEMMGTSLLGETEPHHDKTHHDKPHQDSRQGHEVNVKPGETEAS